MIGDMKYVLDTNVLVAASRSRQGASFAVVQALRERRFIALASVPLMLEYEAVLKRPDHLEAGRRNTADVSAFLDALCLWLEPVHLFYLWRPQCKDAADDMVLETALNGRADGLVTLNIRDFAAASRFGLAVMTPGKLLDDLRQEER